MVWRIIGMYFLNSSPRINLGVNNTKKNINLTKGPLLLITTESTICL